MSKPVYRHLAEQKWRTEGGLDLVVCTLPLATKYGSNVSSRPDGAYTPDERRA